MGIEKERMGIEKERERERRRENRGRATLYQCRGRRN